MHDGDAIIVWTARVALACYATALLGRYVSRGRGGWLRAARAAWTSGFVLFVVHVLTAFHFAHHWSHDAAYEATAEQTAAVVGLDWGGGIFVNHVFMAVWGLDAAWWWRGLRRYEDRPRWIEWTVQGFMAFIVFNATVVFGQGVVRWAGVAAIVAIGAVLAWGWRSPAAPR